MLAANNFPKHRTLCDFRKQHLNAFREVFVQVIQIAREAELIRLGTLAIDGTKIKANASKNILGFRQFSMRGLAAAKGEWDLVCLALNLRRMRTLVRFD